jgi:hypothetical protein
MLGLVTMLAKAELTWLDWMGVAMILMWSGLLALAAERAHRADVDRRGARCRSWHGSSGPPSARQSSDGPKARGSAPLPS